MRIKPLLIAILLFSSISISIAQESKKTVSVFLSSPAFFEKENLISIQSNDFYTDFEFNDWSPIGFSLEKQNEKGNIISVGFWGLSFDLGSYYELYKINPTYNEEEYLGGFKVNSFKTNLLVEYKKRFLDKGNFEAFLGLGVYPYVGHLKISPVISTTYPYSTFYFGSDIALLYSTKYRLNEKVSLNLDIPLNLVGLSFDNVNIENPQWSISKQRTSTFSFSQIEGGVRVILGVSFDL